MLDWRYSVLPVRCALRCGRYLPRPRGVTTRDETGRETATRREATQGRTRQEEEPFFFLSVCVSSRDKGEREDGKTGEETLGQPTLSTHPRACRPRLKNQANPKAKYIINVTSCCVVSQSLVILSLSHFFSTSLALAV